MKIKFLSLEYFYLLVLSAGASPETTKTGIYALLLVTVANKCEFRTNIYASENMPRP